MVNKHVLENASVLLVDDMPENLDVLTNYLDKMGFNLSVALSGEKAIELAKQSQPDIILLDVMMGEMDGFETCRNLKQNQKTKDIPVVFMTSLTDTIDKVKGFEVGGTDYITKPLQYEEFVARINTHLIISYQQKKLSEQNKRLLKMTKKLEYLAKTDPLTKLSNRRDFLDRAKLEYSRHQRVGKEFTLILGDIDFFKELNDNYGHDCGDFILVSVANRMKSILRQSDLIARWGGEEFIILLPETALTNGKNIAEKMRTTVGDPYYRYQEHKITLTMTFGISACNVLQDTTACIKQADRALYRGKLNRNCVVAFE